MGGLSQKQSRDLKLSALSAEESRLGVKKYDAIKGIRILNEVVNELTKSIAEIRLEKEQVKREVLENTSAKDS